MQKLITLLLLSQMTLCPVLAEQTTSVEKTVFGAQIQKTPEIQEQKQEAKMSKCVFCLQILINGKVKDNNTPVQPTKQ